MVVGLGSLQRQDAATGNQVCTVPGGIIVQAYMWSYRYYSPVGSALARHSWAYLCRTYIDGTRVPCTHHTARICTTTQQSTAPHSQGTIHAHDRIAF